MAWEEAASLAGFESGFLQALRQVAHRDHTLDFQAKRPFPLVPDE